MNIGNVSAMPNIGYNACVSKEINSSTAEFSIPNIEEQKSEIPAERNNTTVDAVSVMESMTGKTVGKTPSYAVSDDEAKYFREKYGDTYDDKTVHELYYELADKGIISKNDASTSSGVLEILCVDGFNGMLNGGMGNAHLRVKERVFVNDVCRTDENAYKHEWDSFKGKYNHDVTTWKDAVQESIDFEHYLKENKSNEDYLLQWHFNSVIESLEKTKGVIFQIFG